VFFACEGGRQPPPAAAFRGPVFRAHARCATSAPNTRGGLMALTVKRITLWRREVENQPGVLAGTLEPLANAGADLRLVMGYRFAETTTRAAIALFPVTGHKATA